MELRRSDVVREEESRRKEVQTQRNTAQCRAEQSRGKESNENNQIQQRDTFKKKTKKQ